MMNFPPEDPRPIPAPVCIECKHCRPARGSSPGIGRYSRCAHPSVHRQPVGGEFTLCTQTRTLYGECGPLGRLFEPMEPMKASSRPDVGCVVKAIVVIAVLAVLALIIYMGGVA